MSRDRNCSRFLLVMILSPNHSTRANSLSGAPAEPTPESLPGSTASNPIMSSSRSFRTAVAAPTVTDGEGVQIHRAFPNHQLTELDPFLLLDHMGPVDLKPGEAKGFPDHPHRGFETVTYMLEGEFQHRDSFGHHGTIGPGDVQWMTAGSGLVHSETPGDSIVKNGGRLQGFQLWVNLPKRDKMKPPHYQELPSDRIPTATSDNGNIEAKVIAGEAFGVRGAVETHIPIQYLHFRLKPGAKGSHQVLRDLNALIYVIKGEVTIGARTVPQFHIVALENDADTVEFSAAGAAEILLIAAQPIREPVARYGPFVMNTKKELQEAFDDYNAGRMRSIAVTR
jgi:redox-sensitive bicupin YhaK (pirin superfamily)